MWNKFLVGFNIVLLVVVVVFLFLLCKQNKNVASSNGSIRSNDNAANNETTNGSRSKYKIAYFESDSIYENYSYYKSVRKALTAREGQIQSTLQNLREKFTAKMKEYREKGPNLTQNEQMEYEKSLGQMQAQFDSKQKDLAQQFQDEQNRRLLDVRDRIQQFLKIYARKEGYTFVFSTGTDSQGDNIYYKDSTHNITKELLIGLNAK